MFAVRPRSRALAIVLIATTIGCAGCSTTASQGEASASALAALGSSPSAGPTAEPPTPGEASAAGSARAGEEPATARTRSGSAPTTTGGNAPQPKATDPARRVPADGKAVPAPPGALPGGWEKVDVAGSGISIGLPPGWSDTSATPAAVQLTASDGSSGITISYQPNGTTGSTPQHVLTAAAAAAVRPFGLDATNSTSTAFTVKGYRGLEVVGVPSREELAAATRVLIVGDGVLTLLCVNATTDTAEASLTPLFTSLSLP